MANFPNGVGGDKPQFWTKEPFMLKKKIDGQDYHIQKDFQH